MTTANVQPEMALVASDPLRAQLHTCMASAASGTTLVSGGDLVETLGRVRGRLRVLAVDREQMIPAVASLARYPDAHLIVVTPTIDDAMLAAALREHRVAAFLALRPIGVRPWELSYLTRRLLSPGQLPPSSADLLLWGASTVTWRPRRTADRDQTVRAVEVVAMRFGIGRRLAATAADAAHELLMNAMYDAPVGPDGTPRYAGDRQAAVELLNHEIPTLRLTVDAGHLALDITDPFGRLPRGKVFGGILRGRSGAVAPHASSVLDVSHGGAGLGLFNLHSSAAVFRVEVVPGARTHVAWVIDRSIPQREARNMPRSLVFIQGSAS